MKSKDANDDGCSCCSKAARPDGLNLWQTGIRSLFNFYINRAELERDDAWANVRVEMQRVFDEKGHEPEEWEFQLIRASSTKRGTALFKKQKTSTSLPRQHPTD